MQLYFGLARILLFKSYKDDKAPKVLAYRVIRIFVGKEIYKTKEKDNPDWGGQPSHMGTSSDRTFH
jgi:hypothetical protein